MTYGLHAFYILFRCYIEQIIVCSSNNPLVQNKLLSTSPFSNFFSIWRTPPQIFSSKPVFVQVRHDSLTRPYWKAIFNPSSLSRSRHAKNVKTCVRSKHVYDLLSFEIEVAQRKGTLTFPIFVYGNSWHRFCMFVCVGTRRMPSPHLKCFFQRNGTESNYFYDLRIKQYRLNSDKYLPTYDQNIATWQEPIRNFRGTS